MGWQRMELQLSSLLLALLGSLCTCGCVAAVVAMLGKTKPSVGDCTWLLGESVRKADPHVT